MVKKDFKKTILIIVTALILSIVIAYNVYIPSMKNVIFGNIYIAVPKDLEEYNCSEEDTKTNLLSHVTFNSDDNKIKIIYQCYKTSEMTNVEKELTEENIANIKRNMTREGSVDCETINDIEVLTDAHRKLLFFERNDNIYVVSVDTVSRLVSHIIADKIIKSVE